MKMLESSLLSICKKDMVAIYRSALKAIEPQKLLKNSVSICDNILNVKSHRNEIPETRIDLLECNIHVVGGGKSVFAMACGLAELANQAAATNRFKLGCLSIPIGLRLDFDVAKFNLLNSIGIECLFGSENNLPDDNSVTASQTILSQIKIACDLDMKENHKSLFIVLLSGGGSACLTSPKFINLEEKLHLIKSLVQNGADIVEVNKVRRYFSKIKGGQLAKHILDINPQAKIISLILSDVIDDPIEFIASGPTCLPDNSRDDQRIMLDVLSKYNIKFDQLLESGLQNIDKPKINNSMQNEVVNCIIGNNSLASGAAISCASSLGYHVENLGNKLSGPSQLVIDQLLSRLNVTPQHQKLLILGGGEITIKLLDNETWGLGGRVQELALDYMINTMSKMKTEYPVDVFLAGSTDGQDGPTDVAACLASYIELQEAKSQLTLGDFIKAKQSHDSHNFWSKYKPNWLVRTGLTGTNVMDIYMLAINREIMEQQKAKL